jgi:DNA-binding transcriptional regulator LsrR (DeoR family)
MVKTSEISAHVRWGFVCHCHEGYSAKHVANHFGVSHSSVSRILQKYDATGSVDDPYYTYYNYPIMTKTIMRKNQIIAHTDAEGSF